ncbi:MAG: Gfo/Idh/MocA family protein [Chitinophagales bacterium]
MKTNRREFLKISSLTGIGWVGSGFIKGKTLGNIGEVITHKEHFNMCGFAAPKLDVVRIGFIGLGNRGPSHVSDMTRIEGVEIKALCDIRPDKVNMVKKSLEDSAHNPEVYTGGKDEWKKLCERPDIDLIYIATPWSLHTPIAVYAMNNGKHVCTEVPAAKTIDECWQLVETSERTRKHCMILENCCYDFFELFTLNMVRQGMIGEIVHGEGAYIHDLLAGNFSKEKYYDMWRLKENLRNGNLYPTHGLGPVAQVMNINRGAKMDYLISMQSKDFMMGKMANELAAKDDFYKPFADKNYRGNMNTSTVFTDKGLTIKLQHDVTSPNIYSRIYKISGTKGSALKYPLPGKCSIEGNENWLNQQSYNDMEKKYTPDIVTKVGEMAKKVGGHGGMDFLMNWRTIDCLRNGLPLDIDVYDAASWSVIAPLSEWSVANHSKPINIPDFTSGSWKTNQPVDNTLQKGGTTKVV